MRYFERSEAKHDELLTALWEPTAVIRNVETRRIWIHGTRVYSPPVVEGPCTSLDILLSIFMEQLKDLVLLRHYVDTPNYSSVTTSRDDICPKHDPR
jgi:hypothetical protein